MSNVDGIGNSNPIISQPPAHQAEKAGPRFAPDAILPDSTEPADWLGPVRERPSGPGLPGVPPSQADQGSAGSAGSTRVLSDVSSGLDPSQLVAAEQMRVLGGATATARLLGLDLRPTVMGTLLAPPGNSEALRYLTPALRRAALRSALLKQRSRMRRLFALLQGSDRDGSDNHGRGDDSDGSGSESDAGVPLLEVPPEARSIARYYAGGASLAQPRLTHREHYELIVVGRMLSLLEELSALEDFMLDRMGAFSKG